MFLMPALLAASALAIIPLIVHLLHRQKTTPIEWGAMQFLLETPLSVRRRQRIDHWLLMLLRMAILALLAIMLARPLIPRASMAKAPPMDVAVVIDHSLSMGRQGTKGGTLYDNAVASTEQLAKLLPPSASISIVLAEHTPRLITPSPIALRASFTGGPGSEFSKTLADLRQLKPGTTDANIPEAVRSAIEAATHGRNQRKMVVVCSDDQRSNWLPNNDAAWRLALGDRDTESPTDTPVYSLPLSVGSAANATVSGLTVSPAFLGVHRPAIISAIVGNTGGGDLPPIPVRLLVDGRIVARQQTPAALAAGKSATVRFDYYFPDPGSHWVRIEADLTDGLAADNAATAAVTVSPRLNVLVVDGRLTPGASYPAAAYLTAAMQPVDPSIDPTVMVLPKTISVSEISRARLTDYAVVVLNDVPRLPAEEISRLTDYTLRGNGLWIILGPRTEPSFLTNVLAKSPLLPVQAADKPTQAPDNAPAAIEVKEPQNAAVREITDASPNPFADTALREWWPLKLLGAGPGGTTGAVRTILASTSGDPFTTEMDLGKSGGRVVTWTSPLNGSWNFLHTSPQVVPLVQETLFRLASGSGSDLRQAQAGQTLLWSGPLTPAVESASLLCPDGQTRNLEVQLRGDKYLTTFSGTYLPGLYEMHFLPATVPQPVYYSVNIDPAELDFTPLTVADVHWFEQHHYVKDRITSDTLPTALDAQAGGYELWGPLGLLLLAFLILEVAITRTLARESQISPDKPLHAAAPPPRHAEPLETL
ncbi:MAG TPA: BatA domain-containing protein [Phycisphaerae bacterium]|nr:BatA domain-containing protein [Phycisphaerae bacterium]